MSGEQGNCSSEVRCARTASPAARFCTTADGARAQLRSVTSRRTSRSTKRVQRARERLISSPAGASRRRASTADTKISSAAEAPAQKVRRATRRRMYRWSYTRSCTSQVHHRAHFLLSQARVRRGITPLAHKVRAACAQISHKQRLAAGDFGAYAKLRGRTLRGYRGVGWARGTHGRGLRDPK